MTGQFAIEPHVGVGPVRFGMRADEVEGLLGSPLATVKNHSGEQEALWNGWKVCYGPDGGVVEIIVMHPSRAVLGEVDLLTAPDPVSVVLLEDPDAIEHAGMVFFRKIDLAMMVFENLEDLSVGVFAPGRWTPEMLADFQPFGRK